MQDMVEFWALLKKIFNQNSPRPFMTGKEYAEFFRKTGQKENLSDGSNCEKVFLSSLAGNEELEAAGKYAKSHVEPLTDFDLHVSNPGKSFITAFASVHRDSKEGAKLITKLNRKK